MSFVILSVVLKCLTVGQKGPHFRLMSKCEELTKNEGLFSNNFLGWLEDCIHQKWVSLGQTGLRNQNQQMHSRSLACESNFLIEFAKQLSSTSSAMLHDCSMKVIQTLYPCYAKQNL